MFNILTTMIHAMAWCFWWMLGSLIWLRIAIIGFFVLLIQVALSPFYGRKPGENTPANRYKRALGIRARGFLMISSTIRGEDPRSHDEDAWSELHDMEPQFWPALGNSIWQVLMLVVFYGGLALDADRRGIIDLPLEQWRAEIFGWLDIEDDEAPSDDVPVDTQGPTTLDEEPGAIVDPTEQGAVASLPATPAESDLMAWEAARANGTLGAFREYILVFTNGDHHADAIAASQARLKRLRLTTSYSAVVLNRRIRVQELPGDNEAQSFYGDIGLPISTMAIETARAGIWYVFAGDGPWPYRFASADEVKAAASSFER